MKQELFDLYNSLKNTFIEKIVETIDTKQNDCWDAIGGDWMG